MVYIDLRDVSPIMENRTEQNKGNEIQTGTI